jgi:hypothetical protein
VDTERRVSALEAAMSGFADSASALSESLAAVSAQGELMETALLAIGILDVDAVGDVVEGSLLTEFVLGVGASLDSVTGWFEAWPDLLDPWTDEACAADSASASCIALDGSATLTRDQATGQSTGRRQYSPLVSDLGGDSAEETTTDETATR